MGQSQNIFIIDDDGDFVSLLTEILTQAGYGVSSTTKAEKAAAFLAEAAYDLLVIDQRLGETTGVELLREIRKKHSTLPVIVISGFLDHDSAQEFVNLGVSGIFFKPLNIFALLKRVEELFNGSVKASGLATPDPGIRGFTQTPFGSTVSRELFFKKLQTLVDFRGTLLLIGDESSPFRAVAEEFAKHSAAGEKLLPWQADYAREEGLLRAVGSSPTLFLVERIEALSEAERTLFYRIAKKEAPFEKLPNVRFLFCLNKELDALYEEKAIDDEFYLFLGNLELKLPKIAGLGHIHNPDSVQKALKHLSSTPFKDAKTPARVLVLDDEDLHAQMVVDLLESCKLGALKLNNPSEALLAMRKERFSLIITDFRMPGINGVDFVAQARQTDAALPIFIVTGNIQLPEVVRLGNMGVTRLIQKPIDAKAFMEEVLRAIGK